MKDIKELIYAAVEGNAVKFEELVNAQLQTRAYDAIEALRPEVGASIFGESKKMDDEEEDEEKEDEDEDDEKEVKEALHPNQQKIDVVDDEKIDAKDFAKLRKMKKMKEEVEQIDEISAETLQSYRVKAKAQSNKDAHELRANVLTPKSERKYKGREAFNMMKRVHKRIKGVDAASARLGKTRYDEEVEQVDEVAMPQNQADWQALIAHQIKTTGHPVATDAQFRATHGKDETKKASLEPPMDKVQYASAQGGNVKP